MNKREVAMLHRVQDLLQGIEGLHPRNPCDMAKVAISSRTASEIGRTAYAAIGCFGFGDFEDAEEHFQEAEAILARAKEQMAKATEKFYST